MKLFQPNNLSRLKPEFVPVQENQLVEEIGRLLTQFDVSTSHLSLSSAVGANIISQNLRVETPNHSYFLKRRHLEHREKLEREALLASVLAKRGIKAPGVMTNRLNELVSVDESWCYVLYAFEEGNYFSGKDTQLESAAESFAEITRLAIQPDDLFTHAEGVDHTFTNRLRQLLREPPSTTSAHVNELVNTHTSTILRKIEELEVNQSVVEATLLPMHLDFHPLNLLVRDGRVSCVLDFEHLKPYPVIAAVGFAGYKLIRQILTDANRRSDCGVLVNLWLKGWSSKFPEFPVSPAQFQLGANYRVLALVCFILEAWLQRGDDRFNHDLEKQIMSLYEIDALVVSH